MNQIGRFNIGAVNLFAHFKKKEQYKCKVILYNKDPILFKAFHYYSVLFQKMNSRSAKIFSLLNKKEEPLANDGRQLYILSKSTINSEGHISAEKVSPGFFPGTIGNNISLSPICQPANNDIQSNNLLFTQFTEKKSLNDEKCNLKCISNNAGVIEATLN